MTKDTNKNPYPEELDSEFQSTEDITRIKTNHSKSSQYKLISIGTGTSLGISMYLMIGYIAKYIAGPAVILSIIIAAAASLLSGLYYSELRSRIQKYSSSYTFSLLCIGEFLAFTAIGWNLLLEYIITMALVAKGIATCLNSLLDNVLANAFHDVAPIDGGQYLAEYFDFFAFILPIVMTVLIAFGYRNCDVIRYFILAYNVAVAIFIIVVGAFKADINNWYMVQTTSPDGSTIDVTMNDMMGAGGFFPHGIIGMIRGAAIFFVIFLGIDVITTLSSNVQLNHLRPDSSTSSILKINTNSKSTIRIANFLMTTIVFCVTFGIAIIQTMILPYHLQPDNSLISIIFYEVGWSSIGFAVSILAIVSLAFCLHENSLVILHFIEVLDSEGWLNQHIPINFILISSSCLAGLLSGLFTIGQIIQFLSIGTIIAFTCIAICIILMRYSNELKNGSMSTIDVAESSTTLEYKQISCSAFLMQLFSCRCRSVPSRTSHIVVIVLLITVCGSILGVGLMLRFAINEISTLQPWAMGITECLVVIIVLSTFAICLQPQHNRISAKLFTLPIVPLLPICSILINTCLILWLPAQAWIRLAIWFSIGIIIYIFVTWQRENIETKNISIVMQSDGDVGGITNEGFDTEMIEKEELNEQSIENAYCGRENDTNNPIEHEQKQNINIQSTIGKGRVIEHSPVQQSSITTEPIDSVDDESNKKDSINKSRTPSPPLKNINEIVLASEIPETVIERREPNGNTYFVEDLNQQKNKEKDEESTVDADPEKVILELIDKVLQKDETLSQDINRNPPPENDDFKRSETPERLENDVIAIVHHSQDDKEDLGLKLSKSEPDFNKINSPDLNLTRIPRVKINPYIPPAPKFDHTLYNTISYKNNKNDNRLDNGFLSLKIPHQEPPPDYDEDYDAVPESIKKRGEKFERFIKAKEHPEEIPLESLSIKDRLEQILKRGPPDRYQRTRSVSPSKSIPTTPVLSNRDNERTEPVPVVDTNEKRPFDTVHKQKALFDDVLKSIKLESRPSLMRSKLVKAEPTAKGNDTE